MKAFSRGTDGPLSDTAACTASEMVPIDVWSELGVCYKCTLWLLASVSYCHVCVAAALRRILGTVDGWRVSVAQLISMLALSAAATPSTAVITDSL